MADARIYIEIFVLAVGVVAFIYPLVHGFLFIRTNEIGRASAWMFFAESVGMAVTTLFAFLALSGLLKDTPYWVQAGMRIIILVAAIWSSHNLRRTLKKMRNED